MLSMFCYSNFNKDVSKWIISDTINKEYMFEESPLYYKLDKQPKYDKTKE